MSASLDGLFPGDFQGCGVYCRGNGGNRLGDKALTGEQDIPFHGSPSGEYLKIFPQYKQSVPGELGHFFQHSAILEFLHQRICRVKRNHQLICNLLDTYHRL
jgi:hypothetical protein